MSQLRQIPLIQPEDDLSACKAKFYHLHKQYVKQNSLISQLHQKIHALKTRLDMTQKNVIKDEKSSISSNSYRGKPGIIAAPKQNRTQRHSPTLAKVPEAGIAGAGQAALPSFNVSKEKRKLDQIEFLSRIENSRKQLRNDDILVDDDCMQIFKQNENIHFGSSFQSIRRCNPIKKPSVPETLSTSISNHGSIPLPENDFYISDSNTNTMQTMGFSECSQSSVNSTALGVSSCIPTAQTVKLFDTVVGQTRPSSQLSGITNAFSPSSTTSCPLHCMLLPPAHSKSPPSNSNTNVNSQGNTSLDNSVDSSVNGSVEDSVASLDSDSQSIADSVNSLDSSGNRSDSESRSSVNTPRHIDPAVAKIIEIITPLPGPIYAILLGDIVNRNSNPFSAARSVANALSDDVVANPNYQLLCNAVTDLMKVTDKIRALSFNSNNQTVYLILSFCIFQACFCFEAAVLYDTSVDIQKKLHEKHSNQSSGKEINLRKKDHNCRKLAMIAGDSLTRLSLGLTSPLLAESDMIQICGGTERPIIRLQLPSKRLTISQVISYLLNIYSKRGTGINLRSLIGSVRDSFVDDGSSGDDEDDEAVDALTHKSSTGEVPLNGSTNLITQDLAANPHKTTERSISCPPSTSAESLRTDLNDGDPGSRVLLQSLSSITQSSSGSLSRIRKGAKTSIENSTLPNSSNSVTPFPSSSLCISTRLFTDKKHSYPAALQSNISNSKDSNSNAPPKKIYSLGNSVEQISRSRRLAKRGTSRQVNLTDPSGRPGQSSHSFGVSSAVAYGSTSSSSFDHNMLKTAGRVFDGPILVRTSSSSSPAFFDNIRTNQSASLGNDASTATSQGVSTDGIKSHLSLRQQKISDPVLMMNQKSVGGVFVRPSTDEASLSSRASTRTTTSATSFHDALLVESLRKQIEIKEQTLKQKKDAQCSECVNTEVSRGLVVAEMASPVKSCMMFGHKKPDTIVEKKGLEFASPEKPCLGYGTEVPDTPVGQESSGPGTRPQTSSRQKILSQVSKSLFEPDSP